MLKLLMTKQYYECIANITTWPKVSDMFRPNQRIVRVCEEWRNGRIKHWWIFLIKHWWKREWVLWEEWIEVDREGVHGYWGGRWWEGEGDGGGDGVLGEGGA